MNYFKGQGEEKRDGEVVELPDIDTDILNDPKGYRASKSLADAVNVAITLGMPLLLTGEPGSGKSRLADCIAWELSLGEPLVFTVKSDTKGRDLFYRYDTLGRFHQVQVEKKSSAPQNFIHFEALGEAILRAKQKSFVYDELKIPRERFEYNSEAPQRSVVLIDEIDKAPRDVPNDLLSEIDNLCFKIPELETALGKSVLIELDRKTKDKSDSSTGKPARLRTPIVIITSNSEKALPEAFLRRCVYYHVPFPRFSSDDDKEITVMSVVESRLGKRFEEKNLERLLKEASQFFHYLHNEVSDLGRKPSLAELLNWLYYLLHLEIKTLDGSDKKMINSIKTVLLKNKGDQKSDEVVKEWLDKAKKKA